MTIGYVFKAEFFLPENASNYLKSLADPFDLSTRPITGAKRRKRFVAESTVTEESKNALDEYTSGFDSEQNEKYEKHIVEAIVVDGGTETPSDYNEYLDEKSWFDVEPFDRLKDPMAQKKPQNLATTRWTIYKGLAAIAER